MHVTFTETPTDAEASRDGRVPSSSVHIDASVTQLLPRATDACCIVRATPSSKLQSILSTVSSSCYCCARVQQDFKPAKPSPCLPRRRSRWYVTLPMVVLLLAIADKLLQSTKTDSTETHVPNLPLDDGAIRSMNLRTSNKAVSMLVSVSTGNNAHIAMVTLHIHSHLRCGLTNFTLEVFEDA